MIWVALAIAVISFILIALLAPKPDVEDARASSLEDVNFPQATENAPVPLVLGKVRTRAPNTIWYGQYSTVPKYETVKTGLFSSTTYIVGYNYYVGLDFALCLGEDVVLREIRCDDEIIWSGTLSDTTEQSINFPDLFGGEDEGGGLTGNFTFYPGAFSQTPNAYLEYVLGSGEVPAYNGIARVVLYTAPSGTQSGQWFPDPNPSNEPTFGFDTLTPATLSQPGDYTDLHDYVTQAEIDGGYVTVDDQSTINFTKISSGIDSASVIGNLTWYDDTFTQIGSSNGYQTGSTYNQGQTATLSWGFNPPRTAPVGARYFVIQREFNVNGDSTADWDLNWGVAETTIALSKPSGIYSGLGIGESAQLRPFSFVVQRHTNGLGLNSKKTIGDDMNPAEAIYQIMTDPWIGLGTSASMIDTTNFTAAGNTLHSEGNGVSVFVTSQKEARNVLTEILRQIDGFLYQDPSTQKVKLKLVREDYNPATLTIFDEDDIIEVKKYSRSAWEEIVSEVKVQYKAIDQESDKVAVAQDMAAIDQVGRARTVTMSFPFCYDDDTAMAIAARELGQQSVPLFSMTVELNRGGYDLVPGEVVKISWADFGLSEVIMRVQKPDLGSLVDNRIVVDLIQDKFASGSVVFASPEASSWEDVSQFPNDVTDYDVINSPVFFMRKIDTGVADDAVLPIVLPRKPETYSDNYTLIVGDTSGDLTISDVTNIPYPATATLKAEMPFTSGLEAGYTSGAGFFFENLSGTFTAGTEAQIFAGEAGLIYVDGEIIGVENVGGDSFLGIYRGLFGTSIKTHAVGTRIYQIGPNFIGRGDVQSVLTNGETLYFKILDIVDGRALAKSVATERSSAATSIVTLPLRPRDIQVDGEYNKTIDGTSAFDVTGSATSRNTGTTYPAEDAAAESPVDSETYDIRVYDGSGTLVPALNEDGVTLPQSVDFTLLNQTHNGTGEVQVTAVSAEGDSLGYGSAQITINISITQYNLLTTGDMQDGVREDTILLSGDAQSGTDKILLVGDANDPVSILTSGDEQAGTDTMLLSGDAQSGTDKLIASGDEG
jgi:hypothetical protein